MVEKGLRGGICHVIHRYSKTNNKCMKNYDKKESSYIWYLHGNYLHGWAMSQNINCRWFEMKKKMIICNEVFLKSYDEDSDKGYILELDIKYPNDLHDLHSNLPFLPETMKINKCNKLVCNLYDEDLILFT